MRTNVLQALQGRHHVITPMLSLANLAHRKVNRNRHFRLGSSSEDGDTDVTGARPPPFHSDWPRVRKVINDNYCAHSVAGKVSPVCVTGQVNCAVSGVDRDLNSVTVTREDSHSMTGNLKTRTHLPVFCHVANLVPFADGSPQKKGVNPDYQVPIKSVKGVSCVDQLSSAKCVTNVPTVGARLHRFWQKWAALGVSPQRRLHPTLPVPTQSDKNSHNNKLLCKSPQEQLPVGGIASAVRQKCCNWFKIHSPWGFTSGYFWYPNPTTGGGLSWISANSTPFWKHSHSKWRARRQ